MPSDGEARDEVRERDSFSSSVVGTTLPEPPMTFLLPFRTRQVVPILSGADGSPEGAETGWVCWIYGLAGKPVVWSSHRLAAFRVPPPGQAGTGTSTVQGTAGAEAITRAVPEYL
jgi:hypothetical protein